MLSVSDKVFFFRPEPMVFVAFTLVIPKGGFRNNSSAPLEFASWNCSRTYPLAIRSALGTPDTRVFNRDLHHQSPLKLWGRIG